MKKRNASHSFALFIVGFRRSRRRRAVYIPKMFMFVVVSLRVFNPFLFNFFFPSSLLITFNNNDNNSTTRGGRKEKCKLKPLT